MGCFDVTELICQLGENVQYEMVDETYTVQRCTKVSDRICDTVYDLSITTKDDFQCVDIDYQYCWDEEKIVKDRTCIFSVDFDCGKYKPKDGKGAVGCQKTPTKKCYDTPREVSEQLCKPRTDKWCEKFTNEIPFPVEKQNCHNEAMKKCELEVRTRPKKAKQYTYTKECKPVVRQVCEDAEKKKTASRLRQDPEERVQLQAPGALQGGGEEILLQDREEGLGAGLHQGEEGDHR